MLNTYPAFDSHFHIIDPKYPLTPNQGYLPDSFTVKDYLVRMKEYMLVGGAVVSGSFQAFDQGYLLAALKALGNEFVGVTQIPASISDDELHDLHKGGIRAVRFNLKRGGSEDISQLKHMAERVFDLFSWHVELYIDSINLSELKQTISTLPSASIDHLGLSKAGLPDVKYLLERGVKLKACGFGRVNFDVKSTLPALYKINPEALMFGTDLPSTRAPRAYQDQDIFLVEEAMQDEAKTMAILSENARLFYRRL